MQMWLLQVILFPDCKGRVYTDTLLSSGNRLKHYEDLDRLPNFSKVARKVKKFDVFNVRKYGAVTEVSSTSNLASGYPIDSSEQVLNI